MPLKHALTIFACAHALVFANAGTAQTASQAQPARATHTDPTSYRLTTHNPQTALAARTARSLTAVNAAEKAYQRGRYRSAQRQFTALAKRGNAWAMYNLSAMHAQGEANPSSAAQSRLWLEKSAALGYAQAQYVLGQSYEGGQYGEKDLVKAVTYYALAAHQGNSAAQIELATALFLGRGVAQDVEAAGQWYLSAARAGEIEAQTIVARMFETGEGRPLDERMARYWYQSAAKRGDLPSQAKMFAYERDDARNLAK
jgi:uncharacterized protein